MARSSRGNGINPIIKQRRIFVCATQKVNQQALSQLFLTFSAVLFEVIFK